MDPLTFSMGKSFRYAALTSSVELSDSTRRIIVEYPFRLEAGRIAIGAGDVLEVCRDDIE
jgi:hypothetical protein